MRKKKDTKAPKLQNEKKGSQKEKKKDKENAKKSYLHQSCSTAPSHQISGVREKTNKQLSKITKKTDQKKTNQISTEISLNKRNRV